MQNGAPNDYQQFAPAPTPDAETGFHSELMAAQWFTERPQLCVLQIFSERFPCPFRCANFLRTNFPGTPWYYFYNRKTWLQGRRLTKSPADVLSYAYEI